MKRRIVAMLMTVAMVASLVGCGTTGVSNTGSDKEADTVDTTKKETETQVLKIQVGYENNTAEPAAIAVEKWAELVKEKSNGTMELELFPNSALGKKTDLIDQMILGEAMITVADGAFLADYGISDFGIFYAPFMFESWEEEFKVVESEWYAGICDELANNARLRVLSSNWIYGARHLLTTKPVVTPADLASLKLRVSSNELSIASFETLGAAPVAMDMSDVYQSLQAKTIDGVENPITALANRSFQEVAKNLVKDGHIMAVMMWICGEDFYNTLTEEQQRILTEAADEAGLHNNELQEAAEVAAEKKMIEEGVTIMELTEEEKAAWQEKAMPFYDKAAEKLGWSEGLYDTVKAAGK